MNSRHPARVPLLLLSITLSLAPALPVRVQASEHARTGAGSREVFWIARDDLEHRRMDRWIDREIRGDDGKRVGHLKDFILDVKSGQAVAAVVSVGGVLGVGDTLRLVPLRALGATSGDRDAFVAPLTLAQWQSVPAIKENEFKDGTLHLSAEHRRGLADVQTRFRGDRAMADVDWEREDGVGRLLRASLLRNKPVHAAGEKIGDVEAVAVDLKTGQASVVLDADKALTGVDQDFLVPISRLEFGVWEKTIATSLTREDFRRARRVENTVAAREEPRDRRELETREAASPTPTGRTVPVDRREVKVANSLHAAVRAVEEYWGAQPDLAKLDLDATVEGERLVLRGHVPSEKLYEQAEDAAEAIVSGIKIENRIVIRTR